MKSFGEFLGKRERENRDHLRLLAKILETAGFRVAEHLDNRKEPYFYIHKPGLAESLSFGGVRVYTRGQDIICYRSQNKEQTEPFGSTYELDIKGMFKDMV